MTFSKTVDAVMKLDFASREMLVELLQKRLHQERRNQIARAAAKAKKDFAKGILKTKTAAEIIKELQKE